MLSYLLGGSSSSSPPESQDFRTFSSLWGDDGEKPPRPAGERKQTKKSFAAWQESESDSDEAPIEIGPRGSKPTKQRTRSSITTDEPPANSWAAKRLIMLKQKEKESKIEISAEAWNASLDAVSPSCKDTVEQISPSPRKRLSTEPSPATSTIDDAFSPVSEIAPSPSEVGSEPRKVNPGYAKRRTASEPQKQRTRSAVAPTREKEDLPRTPRRAHTNPAKAPTKRRPSDVRLETAKSEKTGDPPAVTGILLDDAPLRRAHTNPAKQPTKKIAVPKRAQSAVSTRPPPRSPGPTKAKPKAPKQEEAQDASSPIDDESLLPFFLASCPDRDLPDAIELVKKYGGFYAAGDKDDVFNKDVLVAPDADQAKAESWKVGWKGKVEMCFNMLKQLHPDKEAVYAIAVAGGPACDWERTELRNRFCKVHADMKLKVVGDIDDLGAWIERQGYRQKVLNYAQRKAQECVSHQGRKK